MTRIFGAQAVALVILLALGGVLATGGAGAVVAAENASVADDTDDEGVVAESASFETETGLVGAETTGADIVLSQELSRIEEQKGIYRADHEYTIPSTARSLEVTLPTRATVRELDGFTPVDERTYRWDGTTEQPTIGYEMRANRSIDQSGPLGADGRLIYTDVGKWALVSQPSVGHRWSHPRGEPVGFDREASVSGPGAVGDVLAFLGEHDKHTHEAHDQEFRLIVPERATLEEDPEDLFASLADASDSLRVGERDEAVFMIAAPTRKLDWGVRGLQTGPADMWVRDTERLADPNNVWIHEYVHTRQGYLDANDVHWFMEGGATYYAALLTLEQELISFSQFRNRLAVGTQSRFDNSILSRPSTWQSNANYHVGALVAGEIDRQMRLESDRGFSLQEVFREMNARDDVVTAADFREMIRAASSDSVASESDRLTTTTQRPQMWTRAQHDDAFGDPPDPARITFALAETDAVSVAGPYRNRSLTTAERTIVPGETVSLQVDATNFGGQTGEYDVDFRVNDDVVDQRTGSLEANASERLTFEYTPTETGDRRLSVGDATVDIRVQSVEAATIGPISADRTELIVGETVELSTRVTNDANRPAETTVNFTRDGELINRQDVRLDTGGERTVTTQVQIETAGTYRFGVGDSVETVTVTVSEATGQQDGDTTEGDDRSTDNETTETDDTVDDDTAHAGDDSADDDTADADDDGGFGPGSFLVAAILVIAALFAVLVLSRRGST